MSEMKKTIQMSCCPILIILNYDLDYFCFQCFQVAYSKVAILRKLNSIGLWVVNHVMRNRMNAIRIHNSNH